MRVIEPVLFSGKSRYHHHIAVIIVLLTFSCALSSCSGGSQDQSAGVSGNSGTAIQTITFYGRLILRPMMLIPQEAQSTLINLRSSLEAGGYRLSDKGELLVWPDVAAAGWVVQLGNQRILTDAEGFFSISWDGNNQGVVKHPTDEWCKTDFRVEQLSTNSSAPKTLVWYMPFTIPEQNMETISKGGKNDSSQALLEVERNFVLTRASPTQVTYRERGSYPNGVMQQCEDKNGILSGSTNDPILLYIGST